MPNTGPGNDGGFVPIPDLSNPNLYDPSTGSFSPTPTGAVPTLPDTVGSSPTNTGQTSVNSEPGRSTLPPSNKKTPPDLKTLVIAPDVRIIIARGTTQYDVSRDIVRGTVVRRENAASSLAFTLSNKDYRYTGKFQRMDRVICYLKRVGWIQVFSGYLDLVPHMQLYPGTVDFRATCTIKRLMHTWWDPGLDASQGLFDQQEVSQQEEAEGFLGADAGLGSLLRRLLREVGGWPDENIWIQQFPRTFEAFARDHLQRNKQANQEAGDKFRRLLLGSDISLGPGEFAGHNYSAQIGTYAGAPGGGSVAGIQMGPVGVPGSGAMTGLYQREVVTACDLKGMGPLRMDTAEAQGYGAAAAKSTDQRDQEAWKEQQAVALAQEEAGKQNDAAIIAFMVVHVESNWLMWANRADPDSLKYPYDAIGNDHSSTGLFQQQVWWGHVGQRMNARASAMMFYEALDKIQWRNMSRGEAAWRVQQPAEQYRYRYAAYEQVSIQEVKAIRQAAGQNQIPLSGVGAPTGAASTIIGNTVGATLPDIASGPTSVTPGLTSTSSVLGKPKPDSEGAINWAMTQIGVPYVWGGGHGSTGGPGVGLDCSGLTGLAFKAINVGVEGTSEMQMQMGQGIPPSQAQRGDLIFPYADGSHVGIYLGAGSYIHAPTTGSFVQVAPINPLNCIFRRVAPNGGVDPSAPFIPPSLAGPGMPPNSGTGGIDGGTGGNTRDATGSGNEPIARNLYTYQFQHGQFWSEISQMFGEDAQQMEKAYINDEPLIQMVQAMARAGLRHFASAPNGDFVAYYPDYFGLDGKQAVWKLEDIEMKNVTINYCDDALATHVYVRGADGDFAEDMVLNPEDWLRSNGVATVEDAWLFQRLIRASPGAPEAITGSELMKRYGVRPYSTEVSAIKSGEMELMMAIQIFMQKWAEQYASNVDISFMPEIFPGMRVELVGHNIQVYVAEVTHSFDWDGGFSTNCIFMAPSSTNVAERINNPSGVSPQQDTGFQANGSVKFRNAPVDIPVPKGTSSGE